MYLGMLDDMKMLVHYLTRVAAVFSSRLMLISSVTLNRWRLLCSGMGRHIVW